MEDQDIRAYCVSQTHPTPQRSGSLDRRSALGARLRCHRRRDRAVAQFTTVPAASAAVRRIAAEGKVEPKKKCKSRERVTAFAKLPGDARSRKRPLAVSDLAVTYVCTLPIMCWVDLMRSIGPPSLQGLYCLQTSRVYSQLLHV